MTAPATQDIAFARGNSFTISLTFLQPDGVTPVNLSLANTEIWFTIRPAHIIATSDSETPTLQKRLSTGGITLVSGGTTGLAQVNGVPNDTALLSSNTYFYDVQLKEPSGKITTTQHGCVQLTWRATGAIA